MTGEPIGSKSKSTLCKTQEIPSDAGTYTCVESSVGTRKGLPLSLAAQPQGACGIALTGAWNEIVLTVSDVKDYSLTD